MRAGVVMAVVGGLLGATVARAQPVVSMDAPIDAPKIAAQLGDQQRASIAFGGGVYLAVWSDLSSISGASNIRGVRFTASGTVMDSPALTISTGGTQQLNPAVAFDGSKFVVAYSDAGGAAPQIASVLVDPAAPSASAVGATTAVTSGSGAHIAPAVAGGGGSALVCWQHTLAGANFVVECTLYQNEIASTTINAKRVSDATATQVTGVPSVTWSGSGASYLVLWEILPIAGGFAQAPTQVRAALLDATSAKASQQVNTSPPNTNQSATVAHPTAASDGSTYIIYWTDLRANTTISQIWMRTLSLTGTLGATDKVVAANAGAPYERPQAISYGTGKFFVSWEAYDFNASLNLHYGGRYDGSGVGDSTGSVIDATIGQVSHTLPGDTDSQRSAIATDAAGHVFTAWVGYVGGFSGGITGYDVFGLLTDLSASPAPAPDMLPMVPSRVLSQAQSFQRGYHAASNGDTFLVVWEDDRNFDASSLDVYGMRFKLNGLPADSAPFLISSDPADASLGAPNDQITPTVAAIPGGDFLVVWSDGRDLQNTALSIYATRVGADGAVKDPGGFPVSVLPVNAAQQAPTVAGSSAGWLVAWEDWRGVVTNDGNTQVYRNLVAPDGTPGDEKVVADAACAQSATFDGTQYFVAFETPCSQVGNKGQTDVKGAWISKTGVLGATATVSAQAVSERAPAVGSDGKQVYVAWREVMVAGDAIRVVALADAATTPAGAPATLMSGAGVRDAPALGFTAPTDGQPVGLVSWIEDSPAGVMGARIDAKLQTLEAPFVIDANPTLRPTGAEQVTGTQSGIETALRPRFTPAPMLAVTPDGQAVIAYDRLESFAGVATPRVHYRRLGIIGLGEACNDATGCGQGICTRGACCDRPCDGICQACGTKGCIEVPAEEPRCPAMPVSCSALTTECRSFADPPANRCGAFGECASSAELTACTTFTNQPDGTMCATGACMSGQCVAASVANEFRRALPAATGCSLSGSADSSTGGPWMLLALALLVASRRRLRVLGLLFLGGCGYSGTALDVSLRLDDTVFVSAHHARIVISSPGTSFPEMTAAVVKPGLSVANYDADGDGRVDIVVELANDYAFDRTNKLRLTHDPISMPVGLSVKAEVFDGLGNAFARQAPLQAMLSPGVETRVDDMVPKCMNQCSDGTWHLSPADAQTVKFDGAQPTAMAASGGRLVVGAAHELNVNLPNAGLVAVYSSRPWKDGGDTKLVGAAPGDQFGAALAVGDWGVLVGAPGVDSDRGAVYFYAGGDFSTAKVFKGAKPGDRLGSALLVVAPDVVLLGADGASAVYQTRLADFADGDVSATPMVSGKPGTRFGASLAFDGGSAATGAPAEMGGVVYGFTPGSAGAAPSTPTVAQSGMGGFGATLAFARVSGDSPALVVGAPGINQVLAFAAGGKPLVLGGASSSSALGAALAVLPLYGGDAIIAGAPASLQTTPGAGAAYALRAATLKVAPVTQLDPNGTPAAVSVAGVNAGDALGSQLAVGDFDGDGFPDLAVAASKSILVYKGPLP